MYNNVRIQNATWGGATYLIHINSLKTNKHKAISKMVVKNYQFSYCFFVLKEVMLLE